MDNWDAAAREHLARTYSGIFPDAGIERHFEEYIGLDLSRRQLAIIQKITGLNADGTLLDLGCGFGSLVLVARMGGIPAVGIEVAEFEVDYARHRLAEKFGRPTAEGAILHADACATGLGSEEFDVITAWNVLEHIERYPEVIREAWRLLRPGGYFLGIAPNYLAFRKEAHYQIPWLPLLPKKLGVVYLKALGRRPEFLLENIHYVTNWRVLFTLRHCGFQITDLELARIQYPDLIVSNHLRGLAQRLNSMGLMPLIRGLYRIRLWNPLRANIAFIARKPL